HYNMLHYDHSDNWYLGHSVHLNNLHYNKMDTLSDRNVSGRLDYLHLTYFQWISLLIIHLVAG
ncbi:MAG: hypothetical protein WBE68_06830, partial [Candidatus Nitrosopolaris sp.]